MKIPAAAWTAAVPIRLDVLSEFSEPGNSVCEDLLNAVTLDNVSELSVRRSSAAPGAQQSARQLILTVCINYEV